MNCSVISVTPLLPYEASCLASCASRAAAILIFASSSVSELMASRAVSAGVTGSESFAAGQQHRMHTWVIYLATSHLAAFLASVSLIQQRFGNIYSGSEMGMKARSTEQEEKTWHWLRVVEQPPFTYIHDGYNTAMPALSAAHLRTCAWPHCRLLQRQSCVPPSCSQPSVLHLSTGRSEKPG